MSGYDDGSTIADTIVQQRKSGTGSAYTTHTYTYVGTEIWWCMLRLKKTRIDRIPAAAGAGVQMM